MPDFLGFGKLRSGNDAKAAPAGSNTTKKDPNAPQPSLLERMLENAGPIRADGSDKFFGFENFGNTCYCNSILQCLYYTPPFREHVLSYPQRSTPEALAKAASTVAPRGPYKLQNGQLIKPGQTLVQNKVVTPAVQPGQKLEDKDSPEWRKKLALVAGPLVNMAYQNNADYDMPETMFTSLKDLFEAITDQQNRHGVVSPTRFLEILRRDNEMFRSAMHQDAHEFLNLLLNSVRDNIEDHEKRTLEAKHDATAQQNGISEKSESAAVTWPSLLPMPDENSATKWIRDLFEGILTSETRCLTCETTSHRDEPFLDLSVDLEQHSSVTSCLNRFSQEEMLCERDKFHCDHCGGLQEAEKRMKMKRLPQVLALHLKRFKYTEDLQRLQKLFHVVKYPYYLRLFNTTDETEDPDRLYELYAVVVHIGGGPYHGHYVSIIKTQDRGWLLFDDELVEPVDPSYIQNFFGSPSALACAYVLFYRKTTNEEVRREQNLAGRQRTSQESHKEQGFRYAEESAEVHKVQSANASPSPLDTSTFVSLDHAVTAPLLSPQGHPEDPKSPTIAMSTGGFGFSNRWEKSKEEKERKAAEKAADKERERAEKQRKKEMEQKLKETQKRQADEVKTIIDNSKQSKTEEDKRNGIGDAVPETNGISGKDIFRRSKSLRFASFGRKDKIATSTAAVDDTQTLSGAHHVSTVHHHNNVFDDTADGNTADKDKEKKNRFSLRKKSFGILS